VSDIGKLNMSHQFSLSAVGLKLIKSYEGFRATPKRSPSGHWVVGYGHALAENEDGLKLTQKKASAILLEDLAPIETLVNDHIFAPMTQGQFDALCSLAFNIGPADFLKSDVVYALNSGRIIDAANGFDVWRKSEINGEVYVIDSLVRRRTSEKILFLRVEHAQPLASRRSLAPVADEDILLRHLDEPKRIHKDSGIVAPLLSAYKAPTHSEEKPENTLLVDTETANKDVTDEVEQFENWLDDLSPQTPDTKTTGDDANVAERLVTSEDPAISDKIEALIEDDQALERPVEQSPVLMAASAVLGSKILSDTRDIDDDVNDLDVSIDDLEEPLELNTPIDDSDTPLELSTALDNTDNEIDDDSVLESERPITKTSVSPIAEAAADFRKRLDALMVKPAQIDTDPDIDTPKDQDDVDTTVVDLHQDRELTAPKAYANDITDPLSEEHSAAASEMPQETTSSRQDSAGRFIESLPKTDLQTQPSGRPFIIMMFCGLALILASAAAFLTGLDLKFGPAGLFASTVALLFGFLLLLVAFY